MLLLILEFLLSPVTPPHNPRGEQEVLVSRTSWFGLCKHAAAVRLEVRRVPDGESACLRGGTLTEECMEFQGLQLHTRVHCPTNQAHIHLFSYSFQVVLKLFFVVDFKVENFH